MSSPSTGRPAATSLFRTGLFRARRWWYLAAAVLVLALLVWVIAFSSVLGVRSVKVAGTRTLTAAEVRSVAGIRPGTPLVRLDTAAVSQRLRALAPVRSVTVATSYPSSVTISITERVAVGYRPVDGGEVLVDADNVAFRTVRTPPARLPRLQVSGIDAPSAAAARVAAALPARLAAKVSSISAASEESVSLALNDGRTVLWGGTDRSSDKARLLTALLGQPGRYFDLSDPSSVISRGGTGN